MYPNQNQQMLHQNSGPSQGYPPPGQGYPPPGPGQGYPPPGPGQGYPPNQGYPLNQQYAANPYNQPMIIPTSALTHLSGFEKLMSMPAVFVKQKFELLEALTGCETENKYVVYPANADGSKMKDGMFKAKEKSSCLARQCLSGSCRPFKVKIEHEGNGEKFLMLQRDCTMTCCCFNRPFVEVHMVEGGKDQGDYIGKIVNPFKWCDSEVQILDNKGDIKYFIFGDCCQLGFWCKFPCESCQTVKFQILDSHRNSTSGRMTKKSAGCLKSAISDADNFSLVFPKEATREERALLMSAVIMIDFMYFEEKQKQPQQTNL